MISCAKFWDRSATETEAVLGADKVLAKDNRCTTSILALFLVANVTSSFSWIGF